MGCFAHKTFIVLLCCTFLVVISQPHQVSGLNSIDLALKGNPLFPRRSRHLERVAVHDLSHPPSIAPAPSKVFHPDQSSKRRVGRGSDPIHNRYDDQTRRQNISP